MAVQPAQPAAERSKLKRKSRSTRLGVVSSDARDKTIAVTLSYSMVHPKYGKHLRRRTVLHAHDEKNEAARGDTVEIAECRPISKSKHWRLVRVIRKAARESAR